MSVCQSVCLSVSVSVSVYLCVFVVVRVQRRLDYVWMATSSRIFQTACRLNTVQTGGHVFKTQALSSLDRFVCVSVCVCGCLFVCGNVCVLCA